MKVFWLNFTFALLLSFLMIGCASGGGGGGGAGGSRGATDVFGNANFPVVSTMTIRGGASQSVGRIILNDVDIETRINNQPYTISYELTGFSNPSLGNDNFVSISDDGTIFLNNPYASSLNVADIIGSREEGGLGIQELTAFIKISYMQDGEMKTIPPIAYPFILTMVETEPQISDIISFNGYRHTIDGSDAGERINTLDFYRTFSIPENNIQGALAISPGSSSAPLRNLILSGGNSLDANSIISQLGISINNPNDWYLYFDIVDIPNVASAYSCEEDLYIDSMLRLHLNRIFDFEDNTNRELYCQVRVSLDGESYTPITGNIDGDALTSGNLQQVAGIKQGNIEPQDISICIANSAFCSYNAAVGIKITDEGEAPIISLGGNRIDNITDSTKYHKRKYL